MNIFLSFARRKHRFTFSQGTIRDTTEHHKAITILCPRGRPSRRTQWYRVPDEKRREPRVHARTREQEESLHFGSRWDKTAPELRHLINMVRYALSFLTAGTFVGYHSIYIG